MGFSDAFLQNRMPAGDDTGIGLQVGLLMQSVAPEPAVPEVLTHVRASNLCFGVPMNWALNDADRQRELCQTLRRKLQDFEPRLLLIRQIEIHEDEVSNLVEFTIRADARIQDAEAEIELETRLSLFDQKVQAARQ